LFRKAGAHGKQALTMSMGFGCNAAGVIACRIIESPRERMIAILTNNFVPCNGRFPTLLTLASLLALWTSQTNRPGLPVALSVTTTVILGVAATLVVSYLLASTLLKGHAVSFVLEMPPLRMPQPFKILYTSILDRTLYVLVRAVVIAAPAGAITWVMSNVRIAGVNPLTAAASVLDPAARLMGLDGVILLGFLLGLPANEIVIPIILMAYTSTGSLVRVDDVATLGSILMGRGWSPVTLVCMMAFSLCHFPCGTTLLTIYRETGSVKWSVLAAVIPTAVGVLVCVCLNFILRVAHL